MLITLLNKVSLYTNILHALLNLFTSSCQYLYTDISVISVTFSDTVVVLIVLIMKIAVLAIMLETENL